MDATRTDPPPAAPAAAPRSGGRDRALTIVGALISVAALAGVIAWALGQEAPTLPSSGEGLAELLGAVAVYLVGCAARAERWYELLRHNGASPARADAYGLVAVCNLGNNVLPARAGDAARVVLMAPRARCDARTVVGTVVAERVLDVVVLAGLFVAMAYVVLGGVDLPGAGRLAVAALVVAALVLAVVAVGWLAHRRGHLRRALDFVAPMADATRRLRGNHGRELLGWTLLVWALEGTAWWLTAHALRIDLSVLEVGYLMGLGAVLALIPAGPGYIGTFDAAILFGMRALGRTGAQALAYLLLLRFVLTVPITLIGLVVLVTRYGGLRRFRAAVRA